MRVQSVLEILNAVHFFQILPATDPSQEKHKWTSSTTRDFQGFGEYCRQSAYKMCKAGFQETKASQTRDIGLLKDNYRMQAPSQSSYSLDFRCAWSPPTPVAIEFDKAALKLQIKSW